MPVSTSLVEFLVPQRFALAWLLALGRGTACPVDGETIRGGWVLMDKELVVERSYLVAGKATSSKYLVIGSWINFPVTWGGARERWSEMARPRRVVALLAMAVLAVVVVF